MSSTCSIIRRPRGARCKAASGYHGVYRQQAIKLDRNYKAYYRHHGRQVCVGYYRTAEEAARAYNAAVSKIKNRQYPLNDLPPA